MLILKQLPFAFGFIKKLPPGKRESEYLPAGQIFSLFTSNSCYYSDENVEFSLNLFSVPV